MLMQISMMPAVDAVVPLADVTHTFETAGDWSNAANWSGGVVPAAGAKVLVDAAAIYDLDSTAELDWVRVSNNGSLMFADDQDTTLHVETLVGDRDCTIGCASLATPLDAQYKCLIVWVDNGDLDHTVDYELLARGFINLGSSRFYGATITTFDMVSVHPMAGDTSVTFATAPVGWAIGARITIGGTRYYGSKWNGAGSEIYPSQEEDRIITGFADAGHTVQFSGALVYDHEIKQPSEPGVTWDLHTHVMNNDRNIEMRSANTVDPHRRGHTMFMHNPDTRMYYTQFEELGRTVKKHQSDGSTTDTYWPNRALLPFEFGLGTTNTPALAGDVNMKGRYACHIHRTGVESLEFDNQVWIIGCAVNGSPGWGYVAHDSNVLMYLNTGDRITGSGMVTETANERGLWKQNCIMRCEGADFFGLPKGSEHYAINFDAGRNGDAYRNISRQIRMVDNVAHSCMAGAGWFHRSREDDSAGTGLDGALGLDAANIDLPDLFANTTVGNSLRLHPLLHVAGQVSIACGYGIAVEKANPEQNSDIRSVFNRNRAYNCIKTSVAFNYTSHYSDHNGMYIGFDDDVLHQRQSEFIFHTTSNTYDMAWVDFYCENARYVFDADNFFTTPEFNNATQSNRKHMQSGGVKRNIFVAEAKEGAGTTNAGFPYPTPEDQTPKIDQFEIVFLDGKTTPVETHPEGFTFYTFSHATGVDYRILKRDSLGEMTVSDRENLKYTREYIIGFMETLGYYEEVGTGDIWIMAPAYFGDRGADPDDHIRQIEHKLIIPIKLNVSVTSGIYNVGFKKGDIDFSEAPDLNNLVMSGNPYPPLNGRVTNMGDGTYRFFPDPGFDGVQRIDHWMTDEKRHIEKVSTFVDASTVSFPDFVTIDTQAALVEFPAAVTFDITVAA